VPFSKPGFVKSNTLDLSQHDSFGGSARTEESKTETSLIDRDRESTNGKRDKLTITIPGLSSRAESPVHPNGGSSTPSTSSAINEPSSLGFNIEMTARQSDAHLNHETVEEEPEDTTEDQGRVL